MKRDRNGRFVPNRLLPPVPSIPTVAPRQMLQPFDDTDQYQPAPQPDEPLKCAVCGKSGAERMVSWSGQRVDWICDNSQNCLYQLQAPLPPNPIDGVKVSRFVTVEPIRGDDPRPRVNRDDVQTDYPIFGV